MTNVPPKLLAELVYRKWQEDQTADNTARTA